MKNLTKEIRLKLEQLCECDINPIPKHVRDQIYSQIQFPIWGQVNIGIKEWARVTLVVNLR